MPHLRLPKGPVSRVNQKLTSLIAPRNGVYFLYLLLFAAASAVVGEYYLALGEAVLIAILYLAYRRSSGRRKCEVEKQLQRLAGNVDLAARDTMVNCPMPTVIFRPDTDEVVWSNDRFLAITGTKEDGAAFAAAVAAAIEVALKLRY